MQKLEMLTELDKLHGLEKLGGKTREATVAGEAEEAQEDE